MGKEYNEKLRFHECILVHAHSNIRTNEQYSNKKERNSLFHDMNYV